MGCELVMYCQADEGMATSTVAPTVGGAKVTMSEADAGALYAERLSELPPEKDPVLMSTTMAANEPDEEALVSYK